MTSPTVIHVGQKPQVHRAFADFLDGKSAIIHRVELEIVESETGPILVLLLPDQRVIRWALTDLRSISDQAGDDRLVVTSQSDPLARLVLSDAETPAILRSRCGKLRKRPPVRGRARIFGWSFAAVASVAIIVFVLVPVMADQLAEFLPPEGEKALGDTTFEQIRSALSDSDYNPLTICDDPAGTAALARMQRRLEEGTDLPYPLTVHVLDHEMVNAFALPGGRVVFFRGLIESAEHPDEVAAVFAHEIGHVVNRDPARSALRSAGSIGVLGLIFGDFAGGAAVLFMVERLIDATYSQEAESLADSFAHDILVDGGMSPAALVSFFERLRTEYGDTDGLVAHFMAHPRLGNRIEAARIAADRMTGRIRPSLGEADWQDLRGICRSASG